MTALTFFASFGLYLCFAVLWAGRSYQQGYRKGYADGKKQEADFWISAEQGIDRERQKIWQEGD